jgi:guanidinoacetate N-methyltransferase
MEDWQIPVMEAMADIVTAEHGDVLEIGFGRGVSATLIQQAGVRSHTIVECNDNVVARFRRWRASYPGREIRLIHGRWQDTLDMLEWYDGIFFHTYPLDEDEYAEQVVRSVTFAENFFPIAAEHLRQGGVFTYLTNEMDSFSRAHQRLVFRYFQEFALRRVAPLALPEDSRDDLWGDSIVVIKAVK